MQFKTYFRSVLAKKYEGFSDVRIREDGLKPLTCVFITQELQELPSVHWVHVVVLFCFLSQPDQNKCFPKSHLK